MLENGSRRCVRWILSASSQAIRGSRVSSRPPRHVAEPPHFLHHYEEGMSFRRYLEVLAEHERGENLPADYVPSTFLFAFAGTSIVGRVAIRHSLNPYLERFGGHIGYAVVPDTGGKAMPPRSSDNRSGLHGRGLA